MEYEMTVGILHRLSTRYRYQSL